jgi:hypothetical protein
MLVFQQLFTVFKVCCSIDDNAVWFDGLGNFAFKCVKIMEYIFLRGRTLKAFLGKKKGQRGSDGTVCFFNCHLLSFIVEGAIEKLFRSLTRVP